MGFKTFIFICLFIFLCNKNYSQDYFSYSGGNYGGISQVIANPAAAADNRLKFDLIPIGIDVNFNNSWFKVSRAALTSSNGAYPDSWKNATPNVPDNVYKNFTAFKTTKDRAAVVEGRVFLPSFLIQLNSKNSIAFTWSVRQIGNVDGISSQFANLFEKELDLGVTQNNRIQNKNLSAVQMTWAEYGLTYARVLKDRNEHFVKVGITPKILQGLESAYLVIKDLDFLLSTKDTSSYFNSKISYAHSSNLRSPVPVSDFYHHVTSPALGLDIGIIYEWRPNYQKFKYRQSKNHYAWRKDMNKYRLKLGASIVDIGKIKFQKDGGYNDLNVSLNKDNFTQFTSVSDYKMFDSLLKAKFSDQNGKNDYSVLLPTAVNLQSDFAVNRFFYLNLSAHLADFYRSKDLRVHNYSAICFAPRIEENWYTIAVPITYNTLSARHSQYATVGFNIRLGPITIGTNNLMPFFTKGDLSAYNLFAMLKVSIPYKVTRDLDRDGVLDDKDACPDDSGSVVLQGCPDVDRDGIADKDDACPHQKGLPEFKGCPDTDGDGIRDGDDECPLQKGSLALKGCPDFDGDSIPDKDDACPKAAGPKQFKGCPDTDHDGIIDIEDACPTMKGIAKYKGCMDTDRDGSYDNIDQCIDVVGPPENKGCPWPDTDKDGIIDKLDSCITVFGVREYKGCPAPLQLAAVEKRIIQKAYSSLEFATGKDLIKPVSLPSLNALAKLLVVHQEDWQLKLDGHTDNEGTEESNMILSEKRAKAVQSYLSKKGVPVKNISTAWFGQSKPLADNATPQGRKKNRRVEMAILQKTD